MPLDPLVILSGVPSIAQILQVLGDLGKFCSVSYSGVGSWTPTGVSGLGPNLADETAQAMIGLMDLSHVRLSREATSQYSLLSSRARWDRLYRGETMRLVAFLVHEIQNGLPRPDPGDTGPFWSIVPGGGSVVQNLSGWLSRANGFSSLANPDPTDFTDWVATATGLASPDGGFTGVSSTDAPEIAVSWVTDRDMEESLASDPVQLPVGLTGSETAWTIPTRTAPTRPLGSTRLRVYRTRVGDAGGALIWDQDVPLGPGTAFPDVTISRPDSALLRYAGIQPPQFAGSLVGQDAALSVAAAFAGFPSAGRPGPGPMVCRSSGMLDPTVVGLPPAIHTPQPNIYFGTLTRAGGVNTYVQGVTMPSAHNPAAGIQGVCGAIGIQVFFDPLVLAAGSITATYTYYDQATLYGTPQTGSVTGSYASGDSVAVLGIPRSRLVIGVSDVTITGLTVDRVIRVEGIPLS